MASPSCVSAWMCVSFMLTFLMVASPCVSDAQEPSEKAKMNERALVYVLAKRGCTQEDAPALEIYFSRTKYNGGGEPKPPYLRFEISSSSRDPVMPGTHFLSGLQREPEKVERIVRGEFVETGHNGVWLKGTIVLDEVVPGGKVRGRYDVTGPGGLHLRNSFRTEYLGGPAMCG